MCIHGRYRHVLRKRAVSIRADKACGCRHRVDRAQHGIDQHALADADRIDPCADRDDAAAGIGALDTRKGECGAGPAAVVVRGRRGARLIGRRGDRLRIPADACVDVRVVDGGRPDAGSILRRGGNRHSNIVTKLELLVTAMTAQQDGVHRLGQLHSVRSTAWLLPLFASIAFDRNVVVVALVGAEDVAFSRQAGRFVERTRSNGNLRPRGRPPEQHRATLATESPLRSRG